MLGARVKRQVQRELVRTSTAVMIWCQMEWRLARRLLNSLASAELGVSVRYSFLRGFVKPLHQGDVLKARQY